MYLSVDLAIFERLVGAPIDNQSRPVTDARGIPVNRLLFAPPLSDVGRVPSYGVRIPLMSRKRDTQNVFSSKNANSIRMNDFSRTAFKPIPVFPENIAGQEYENIWPAVSFYWLAEEFQSQTYLYADPIELVDSTAPTVQAKDENGNVVAEGQTRKKYVALPDPYDLIYMIRVWSKDMIELRLICDCIKRIFPARGALEVERADGSKLVLDMILESIDNYDIGREEVAILGLEEQRGYSRAFVYRIESYMDNTLDDNAQWVNETIRSRILELRQIQDNLAKEQTSQVGLEDVLETESLK